MNQSHQSSETRPAHWSAASDRAPARPVNAAPVEDRVLDDGPAAPAVPPHEILKAEQHVPEGRGPWLGERRTLVTVVSILAIIGVVGIGALLGALSGWQAAAVGVAWVLMGYVVAWIVVWGAGLMRALDEETIEAEIIQEQEIRQ